MIHEVVGSFVRNNSNSDLVQDIICFGDSFNGLGCFDRYISRCLIFVLLLTAFRTATSISVSYSKQALTTINLKWCADYEASFPS